MRIDAVPYPCLRIGPSLSVHVVCLTAEIEDLRHLIHRYGPSISRQAVRNAADLLQRNFRRTDIVARLGETCFMVLAPGALEPGAAVMRRRVEQHLLALNRSSAPCRDIALKFSTVFWSASAGKPLLELLCIVHKDSSSSGAMAACNSEGRRLPLLRRIL